MASERLLRERYAIPSFTEWVWRNHRQELADAFFAAESQAIPNLTRADVLEYAAEDLDVRVLDSERRAELRAEYEEKMRPKRTRAAERLVELGAKQIEGELREDEQRELSFINELAEDPNWLGPENAAGKTSFQAAFDAATAEQEQADAAAAAGISGFNVDAPYDPATALFRPGGDKRPNYNVDMAGLLEHFAMTGPSASALGEWASGVLANAEAAAQARGESLGQVDVFDVLENVPVAIFGDFAGGDVNAALDRQRAQTGRGIAYSHPTQQAAALGVSSPDMIPRDLTDRTDRTGFYDEGTYSVPKALRLIDTLDPESLIRIQQHLAAAGYYDSATVANNDIVWGVADVDTRGAWSQLVLDALNENSSVADVLYRRQLGYADQLQESLSEGFSLGADVVEVTLSDEDTIRTTARERFRDVLGREPTDEELPVLVSLIHDAQRAQGQARIDAYDQLERQATSAIAQNLAISPGGGPGGLVIPVAGVTKDQLSSSFGAARDGGARRHKGIDIFAAEGTPVVAATGGTVMVAGPSGGKAGRRVWIRGDDGRFYFYAHLSRVKPGIIGTRVDVGDVIGNVGNTGNARGTPPHLHFSVNSRNRVETGELDPYALLTQPGVGDTRTGRPAPYGPSSGVDQFMAAIRQHESGGDYGARNPVSSASGAYQFIDSTWRGLSGRSDRAYQAPVHVQDAVMRDWALRQFRSLGDWRKVAIAHYYPAALMYPDRMNRVPGRGNRLTPAEFGDRILALMGQQDPRSLAQGAAPWLTDAPIGLGPGTPGLDEIGADLERSLVETEGVDVAASLEEWARKNRPAEWNAQRIGDAYYDLVGLLGGEVAGVL